MPRLYHKYPMNQLHMNQSLYTVKDFVEYSLCEAKVYGSKKNYCLDSSDMAKLLESPKISSNSLKFAIYDQLFMGNSSEKRINELKKLFIE